MHGYLVTDQYLRAIYVLRSENIHYITTTKNIDNAIGKSKLKLPIAAIKLSGNSQRMECLS